MSATQTETKISVWSLLITVPLLIVVHGNFLWKVYCMCVNRNAQLGIKLPKEGGNIAEKKFSLEHKMKQVLYDSDYKPITPNLISCCSSYTGKHSCVLLAIEYSMLLVKRNVKIGNFLLM